MNRRSFLTTLATIPLAAATAAIVVPVSGMTQVLVNGLPATTRLADGRAFLMIQTPRALREGEIVRIAGAPDGVGIAVTPLAAHACGMIQIAGPCRVLSAA